MIPSFKGSLSVFPFGSVEYAYILKQEFTVGLVLNNIDIVSQVFNETPVTD